MTVRTRFAPSPTGNGHIGNIRAALYNWLFARHEGGQFLLRIEDTDRERSTPQAVQTVLDSMNWLGLNYDENPVYQSTQLPAHLEAAEKLLQLCGLTLADVQQSAAADQPDLIVADLGELARKIEEARDAR